MKKSVSTVAAAFATMVFPVASAFAVPIGSLPFSPASTSPTFTFNPAVAAGTTGSLATLVSIFFKNANLVVNGTSPTNGDGSANVLYTSPTPSADQLVSGGTNTVSLNSSATGLTFSDLSYDGVIGVFTQSAPAVVASFYSSGQFASETIDVEGTLAGGTAEGLSKLSASLTISLTQTGGAGNAISISGTLATPSTFNVPEPASLAILGASLFGIGFIRRRR